MRHFGRVPINYCVKDVSGQAPGRDDWSNAETSRLVVSNPANFARTPADGFLVNIPNSGDEAQGTRSIV